MPELFILNVGNIQNYYVKNMSVPYNTLMDVNNVM